MYPVCIKVCILTLKCKYRPDTDVSLRIHLDTLDTQWIRARYVSKARYMTDTCWIRIEGKPSLFRGKTEPIPTSCKIAWQEPVAYACDAGTPMGTVGGGYGEAKLI